jgi:2-phospho-L-lactate guanylyltransferase
MHNARRAEQGRRLWAAVPFKGPVGSKRRLAALLSPEERARLSLAMLDGVLEALLGVSVIERVLLLRPPATADSPRGLPADARLTVVDEAAEGYSDGRDNLNGTLVQAQALATSGGADALLILPADLPLVTSADLAAMLDAAAMAPIAIAPDRAETGTNALLLTPPMAIGPSFGEGSFQQHRRLAADTGLTIAVVHRPGLALDLDTPADVARLLALRPESQIVELLRAFQVEQRLVQAAVSGP